MNLRSEAHVSMNQRRDPGCVSVATCIDLLSMNFHEFQDQLNSIHGQLQHVASRRSDKNYWIFPDLQWWYTVVCLPESEIVSSHLWHCLSSEEAYELMVDQFLRNEASNAHIVLTNVSV